jgi:hypothetical protein
MIDFILIAVVLIRILVAVMVVFGILVLGCKLSEWLS